MAEMNIPFKMPNPVNLGRHTDVMFAIGAVMVIMMLIIPLPTMILDLLLVVNIVISLLILLMVLSIKSANDFSVFPSVLLIMTAFRLALNITTPTTTFPETTKFAKAVITLPSKFAP